MRRLGVLAALLLMVPASGGAQQTRPLPSAPSHAQSQTGRASYDPMTRGSANGQSKGIVEATLASVNPQNKDYGAEVEEWRRAFLAATVERVYLWCILVLCLGLSISLAGNGWFLRERQRRLSISSEIVAQLYNAFIGSRAKGLDVIVRYNTLVERFNHLSDERNDLRGKLSNHKAEEEKKGSDFDGASQEKMPDHVRAEIAKRRSGEDRAPAPEVPIGGEDVRTQLVELEARLQRKEAQLEARDNQITNLRGRLSRAHDMLEGERQQKSGTK
jgi:hypothetical protein